MTWGTTEHFLDKFGIERLEDLPGIDELKAAGLLDARPGIMSVGRLSDGDISESSSGNDDENVEESVFQEDAQNELNDNPQGDLKDIEAEKPKYSA